MTNKSTKQCNLIRMKIYSTQDECLSYKGEQLKKNDRILIQNFESTLFLKNVSEVL